MAFEKQESESESQSAENRETTERQKKGVYLKGFVALTNGFLSARKQRSADKNFFIDGIEHTKSTYQALNNLEKEIDPEGNLSADIEDRITNGVGKLADWIKGRGETPEK